MAEFITTQWQPVSCPQVDRNGPAAGAKIWYIGNVDKENAAFENWLSQVVAHAELPQEERHAQLSDAEAVRQQRAVVAELYAGSLSKALKLTRRLYEADGTVQTPAAKAQPHGDFRRQLHGQPAAKRTSPLTPQAGQSHTIAADMAEQSAARLALDGIASARAALDWSCARFAQFQAELQTSGDRNQVFAAAGLSSIHAQRAVVDGWAKRLASEPALQAEFETKLAALLRAKA